MAKMDELLFALRGPVSDSWHQANEDYHNAHCRRNRAEEKTKELGAELIALVRRTFRDAWCSTPGGNWFDLTITGPGYILEHGGPKAIKKPYMTLRVFVRGAGLIEYNFWPKHHDQVRDMAVRIKKAMEALRGE